ncbi:polysaccharide biosynthesis C-terminal domain-containing protein [Micromonospora sp. DT233]|uniref:polysaccharide biosynthesis C-terminal domain-containing protein n=1 Tax=Micromonospora sp. DT233 TaxID=3393432 RepID=UPI003CE6F71E
MRRGAGSLRRAAGRLRDRSRLLRGRLRPRGGLTRQTLVLAGATAVSQLGYAGLLVVVAKHAGPADLGAATAAIGLGSFLGGLLDYGFTSYSLRELAAGRMATVEYWSRLRAKLVLTAAVGLAAVLVAVVALPDPGLVVGAAVVAFGRILVLGVTIPNRADRRVASIAGVTVLERVVALVTYLVVDAVRPGDPVSALWLALGLGTLVAGCCGLLLTPGGHRLVTSRRLVNPWSAVAGFGSYALAVSACSLDTALLGLAGGGVQAGLYGAVSRWTQPAQLIAQSYAMAAVPPLAAAQSTRAAARIVRNSLAFLLLGVAACAALAAAAPALVPLVLGESYRGSAPVLVLLAGSAAVVLLNQPLLTVLTSRGRDRFVGRATVVTVAAQLLGVWLLAGPAGALGAALAALLSQAALTVVLAVGLARLIHGESAPDTAAPTPAPAAPVAPAEPATPTELSTPAGPTVPTGPAAPAATPRAGEPAGAATRLPR